jgi:hypothetical protein
VLYTAHILVSLQRQGWLEHIHWVYERVHHQKDKTDIKDEIDQEFALLDKIDSETETMWDKLIQTKEVRSTL